MYCGKCGAEAANSQQFCSECGSAFDWQANSPGLASAAATKIDSSKIAELNARLSGIESSLPQTNILSVKFWPRAFAVFGHNMAISGLIYGVLFALALAIGLITSFAK